MGDGNRWRPFWKNGRHFVYGTKSAMALFLKMFVRSYSITVPNFKFVSQSARFGQNFTPTTPTREKKKKDCIRSPTLANHSATKFFAATPLPLCFFSCKKFWHQKNGKISLEANHNVLFESTTLVIDSLCCRFFFRKRYCYMAEQLGQK